MHGEKIQGLASVVTIDLSFLLLHGALPGEYVFTTREELSPFSLPLLRTHFSASMPSQKDTDPLLSIKQFI